MPDSHYFRVEEVGKVWGDPVAMDTLRIFLYPWNEGQLSACNGGGLVVEALRDAGEQLYDYGAIDRCEIWRFPAEEYAFPASSVIGDFGQLDARTIDDMFVSWLETDNGTGEDLSETVGVHQLIHGGGTGCVETAGAYAPAGAGAEHSEVPAFETGVAAWSPVCDDEGLTKNAAIQEALHTAIGGDWSRWAGTTEQWREAYGRPTADSDLHEFDQHTLGDTVGSPSRVTPMLTYHWDDDPEGGCATEYSTPVGYTQELTDCTKEAIKQTPKGP